MKILKENLKKLLLLIIILTVLTSTTENVYLLNNLPDNYNNDNDDNNIGKIITVIIILISTYLILMSKATDKATNIRYTEIQKIYPCAEKPYTKEELDCLLSGVNTDYGVNINSNSKKILVNLILDQEIFEAMSSRFLLFFTIFMGFYHVLYSYDMLGFKNSIDNYILKIKNKYPNIFKSRFFLIVFIYWCLLIIIHKYLC